jgi:endonuclease/exonuclease/phosphatase family metal-dependent hydrolase
MFNFKKSRENICIATFNIRACGLKKIMKPVVSDRIVAILQNFDVCLIQEIRDVQETNPSRGHTVLFSTLLNQLNKCSTVKYKCISSHKLGKTTVYREKLAYIYRADLLEVKRSMYMHHFVKDFEREPFVVTFYLKKNRNIRLILIGVHVKPDDAVQEMIALRHVYEEVKRQWSPNTLRTLLSDIKTKLPFFVHWLVPVKITIGPILMGDLNCAQNYISLKSRASIHIFTDPSLKWLVDSTTDTTVSSNTNYAYDHIIVPKKQEKYFDNKAEVIKFDKIMGISSHDALDISDHYPVSVKLYIQ